MLRTGWRPGPEAGTDGAVLVSVTDFTFARRLDLPGIARAAVRLRRGWPTLDGAVGLWLWTAPWARRCGAVSVWTGDQALYGFVGLPDHVAIMRKYRTRGETRVTTWMSPGFDEARVWRDAYRVLMGSEDAGAAPDGGRGGPGADVSTPDGAIPGAPEAAPPAPRRADGSAAGCSSAGPPRPPKPRG